MNVGELKAILAPLPHEQLVRVRVEFPLDNFGCVVKDVDCDADVSETVDLWVRLTATVEEYR